MKVLLLAAALVLTALPVSAGARTVYRSYVTQIEVNSATNEIRVWLAFRKGIKGRRDVNLDPADPLLKYKLDLARDSLKLRLPVKVYVNNRNQVTGFILRVYPSKKQVGR